MTDPMDRLRAADPAASLRLPDERAEADLQLLLAEPRSIPAPAPERPRRLRAPVLVTAVVALAVVALTAAVLGFVRPRVDVGGTPATITPTLGTGDCRPAQVLPFQCGTYESTYGGKAITGDLGGPAKDRLSMSFTPQGDALLLRARTADCFAARMLVRVDGKRLVRIGTPTYSGNGCHGRGADRRSWAYAFLNGPLDHLDPSGPYFGKDASAVYFEYRGAAPLGAKQLPRNELTCVPAHVAPFSCATYFSSGGTGDLAFLRTDLFRLSFHHVNGQLTAGLSGRCNALGVAVQPDGSTLVTQGSSSTAMLCLGAPGAQDSAMMRFFSGTLTYRVAGDTVEFRSGSATAVFTRALSACHPASSPFCGTFRASGGNGPLGFLSSSATRLTFAQDGTRTTATVQLACGSRTYAVALGDLRFTPISSTTRSCSPTAGRQDAAVDAFLRAGVTWRWDGKRLSFDRAASGPAASAEFAR